LRLKEPTAREKNARWWRCHRRWGWGRRRCRRAHRRPWVRAASSHLTDLRSLRRENERERKVSLRSSGSGSGGGGKRRRESEVEAKARTRGRERGGDEGGGAGGRRLLGFGWRRRGCGYIGLGC
jgi:hypothetical protein